MARAHITTTADGRGVLQRESDKLRAKVVRLIAADATRYAPRDTNDLARSIEAAPALGRVYVGTDHWAPQEFGAAAHDIPNAFGWGITVRHPGNAAQPFMRPALYTKRGAL